MEQLLSFFEDVKDPRSNRNQKHPFKMLIGTSLLATLGGIDTFSGFADFTESHLEMLQNHFDFPNGPPSHDTYQRFWDAISPQEFYRSFQEFTEILADLVSEIISIDGKVIRNSGKEKALHIVSAWCQSNQQPMGL